MGAPKRTRTLSDQLSVRIAQVLVDFVIAAAALQAAYLIRFEGNVPEQFYRQMVVCLPYLALLRFVTHAFFGVYRIVWRYVGVHETLRFAQSVGAVSALLLTIRLLYEGTVPYFRIPTSIIIMEGTFVFIGMTSARFLRRIQHERRDGNHRETPSRPAKATLLIGAGEAGLALAKEAARSNHNGVNVVGFLDDDAAKAGKDVHGARVLGTLHDLPKVLETHAVKQVFITANNIPPEQILQVMKRCQHLGVEVRIVPGLSEILGSDIAVQLLREVRIEDLLARAPVPPSLSHTDLKAEFVGKKILVTGAGGSIGSELTRQILSLSPSCLILAERDENNLFEIDRRLASVDEANVRVPILADVSDERTMDELFRRHRPDVVFHAAAYKHVPVMEAFPALAAANNVLSTKLLIDLCEKYDAGSFVMISTDKAVNPSSVMGATKRVAELLVQRAARSTGTRFSCVRFGNVLGSRGSVVGIFKDQIRRGGPVTVTHEDATRYFMTVQEAVNLVLQASTLGDDGAVFLLDMGKPVKIVDMARQMIQLSGLTEAQVPIEVVGLRPGEKLFEELSVDCEKIAPTALRKVFRCAPMEPDDALATRALERLQQMVATNDHDGVRAVLGSLGIGYKNPKNPVQVSRAAAPALTTGPQAVEHA